MSYPVRMCVAIFVSGVTVALSQAQTPSANSTANNSRSNGDATARPNRRQSIVQHYSLPYPEFYHGEPSAGFRNPGGTGRFLEWYPPGGQFQQPADRVRVAGFGNGAAPGTSRADQNSAFQIGIQRQNSIHQNMGGGQFGVGFFGGMY